MWLTSRFLRSGKPFHLKAKRSRRGINGGAKTKRRDVVGMTNVEDQFNAPARSQQLTGKDRHRTLTALTLGHSIEYFDFGVYAYMATTLAVLFFPSESTLASLLAVFAVFAVPFLARPLGGIIFGHLGDRVGRRKVLVITITMMGAGAGLIGVLPTFDSIGFWAPVLLVLLRVVHGLSIGGEVTGAITYVVESAPEGRRGLYGSIAASGTVIGATAAAGTALLLSTAFSQEEILAWAWRLPFLAAIPLTGTALYLRWKIQDSPAFVHASRNGETVENPLGTAIKHAGGTVFKLFVLSAAMVIGAYLSMVYVITHLIANLGYTPMVASSVTSFGLIVLVLFFPLVGMLSDRVGRKPVLCAGLVGFVVLSIPALLLMGTGGFTLAFIGFLILNIPTLLLQSTNYTFMAELFPVGVRFSGMALAFNAGSVVGGLAPLLATLLIGITSNNLVPGFICMIAAVFGLLALRGLKETARSKLA